MPPGNTGPLMRSPSMTVEYEVNANDSNDQSPPNHLDWSHLSGMQGEAFYRPAFDTLSKAVIITDAAGGIRYLNPVAERLLGYRLSEVYRWALPAVMTSPDNVWRHTENGLKYLRQVSHANTVTLQRRAGGSIRVRIDRLGLPATLGSGFVLQEVAEDLAAGTRHQAEGSVGRRDSTGERKMEKDARCGERTFLHASVILRGVDGAEVRGVIRNIDCRGLFITTIRPHQIQSCVVVKLISEEIPDMCLFQAAAIVVHRQSDGVGVILPEGTGHIIRSLCPPKEHAGRAALG